MNKPVTIEDVDKFMAAIGFDNAPLWQKQLILRFVNLPPEQRTLIYRMRGFGPSNALMLSELYLLHLNEKEKNK